MLAEQLVSHLGRLRSKIIKLLISRKKKSILKISKKLIRLSYDSRKF